MHLEHLKRNSNESKAIQGDLEYYQMTIITDSSPYTPSSTIDHRLSVAPMLDCDKAVAETL